MLYLEEQWFKGGRKEGPSGVVGQVLRSVWWRVGRGANLLSNYLSLAPFTIQLQFSNHSTHQREIKSDMYFFLN